MANNLLGLSNFKNIWLYYCIMYFKSLKVLVDKRQCPELLDNEGTHFSKVLPQSVTLVALISY